MIAVQIDMDVHGKSENIFGLCSIAIWNIGLNSDGTGNYKYAISHQFNSVYGEKAAEKTGIKSPTAKQLVLDEYGPWVWKQGILKNFKRSDGVAKLLSKCLKDAKL